MVMTTLLQLVWVVTSIASISCFQNHLNFIKSTRNPRHAHQMMIDSLLTSTTIQLTDLFPVDTNTLSTGSFLVQNSQADDIQNAGIIAAAISYFIYEKRPRGSATVELFEVKKSSIPGANLGLFCKSIIPTETVLGTYPGVLGKVTKALERSKCF